MCKQIVVPLLFLLCAGAVAQDDASRYKVDCSKFGPGCSSYNRMVERGNGVILNAVKSHAFVCFRTGEDVFLILNHQEPDESRFVRTGTPGEWVQGGMINYRRFKNGVSDESKPLYGTWAKSDYASGRHAEFIPSKNGSAIFDSAVLSLAYDSPKHENGTRYFMIVNLSTLAFSEAHSPSDDMNKEAGSCVEFKLPIERTN